MYGRVFHSQLCWWRHEEIHAPVGALWSLLRKQNFAAGHYRLIRLFWLWIRSKSSVKRVTHICYTKFVDTATLLHMVKVFSVILLISIGVLWIFCFFMGLSIRKTKKHLKFKLQLHRFDIEYLLHAQNSILALDWMTRHFRVDACKPKAELNSRFFGCSVHFGVLI